MREDLASAGDGPAPSNEEQIRARTMLRAELSACQGLIADCAGIAGNTDEGAAARMLAAQTAAKLAAASALAASAIARLADAETRHRLANVKIELSLNPHGGRAPKYDDGFRSNPESEKSTNNPLPRVRTV